MVLGSPGQILDHGQVVRAQLLGDRARDLVIRVFWIVLAMDEDRARRGERGDDVHVPARAELVVVAREPALEPDHALGADRAGELGFHLGLVPIPIAIRVELDGAGDQHRARAVATGHRVLGSP